MRFTPHSLKRSSINRATFLAINKHSFPCPTPGSIEEGWESLMGRRAPLVSRGFCGLQFLGLEVFFQPLPVFPNQPGVRQELVSLRRGGIAQDVFFLEHVPKVCSVFETVGHVLDHLILRFRMLVTE